jgi:hypothetical protein
MGEVAPSGAKAARSFSFVGLIDLAVVHPPINQFRNHLILGLGLNRQHPSEAYHVRPRSNGLGSQL